MDIRKDQFHLEAVRLLEHIADSHFIAFDFEFSGVAERSRDRIGKQNLEERYEETRASVQDFQPLQIGLTIAKFDREKRQYVLEPYNINISPLPLLRERQFTRKWSMSSGAVSFLHRNGFDFQRQIVHGVPYLSLQEEDQARTRMTADSKREDMVLKPSDQHLVDHLRASIGKWQSQPVEEREEYLNIPHDNPADISPELNGYQRRLVHQIVQNEYPGMKSQGMGHFVQITNPSLTQQASLQQLEEEARERDLSRAVGFRWIIDGIIGRDLSRLPEEYLLSAVKNADPADGEKPVVAFRDNLIRKLQERRKILIGHNCMTDIMFLYKMTIGDLPLTLRDFKDKVHDLFPAIIDTKFLSSCYSEKHGRLALGEVAQDLDSDTGVLPTIHTSREFDRYMENAYLHEAGYDSYITAIVAIRMAAKLHRDGSQRKKDFERQQQEVAEAAASSPPEFGAAEGYVTATEDHDTGVTEVGSSELAPASDVAVPASSVVAVKTQTELQSDSAPVSWKDESQVAKLRSAFASTSIYERFDPSSSHMPGDAEVQSPESIDMTASETPEQAVDRLVKEGRLMPRWGKEAAFWDFYGNKLQMNGTQEGVLNIVD